LSDTTQHPKKLQGNLLEIMGPFMDGEVLLEVDLVNSAKRTQKIAYARPQAFDGVGVHLADSVAIHIAFFKIS